MRSSLIFAQLSRWHGVPLHLATGSFRCDVPCLRTVPCFVLFAYFIRISQRHPEKALAPGFECDDMLARGENNPPECHHAFLADRLANDSKRLLADFAIWNEVVGAV